LFITTANSLAGIPEPLRDRMEILRIAGYLDHEKLAIARQYLVPRQIEVNGLKKEEVVLEPDVMMAIMRGYTREAGVRELERRIARVARKLARRRAEQNRTERPAVSTEPGELSELAAATTSGPARVAVSDLKDLLGNAPYDPSELTLESK